MVKKGKNNTRNIILILKYNSGCNCIHNRWMYAGTRVLNDFRYNYVGNNVHSNEVFVYFLKRKNGKSVRILFEKEKR